MIKAEDSRKGDVSNDSPTGDDLGAENVCFIDIFYLSMRCFRIEMTSERRKRKEVKRSKKLKSLLKRRKGKGEVQN